jgi:hypothetical protein
MPGPKTLIVAIILLALVLYTAHNAKYGMDATLPADMPANARFVKTGWNIEHNEPTGYWVTCHADPEQPFDWCRVTDPHGMVVFQGEFLPVDSTVRVADPDLAIGHMDPKRLWTDGTVEKAPIPVIPLASGRILVPEDDRTILIDRWAHDPDESHKYLQASN